MALQICCPKPQLQRLMLKPVPGLMAAFLLGMTTFLPTLMHPTWGCLCTLSGAFAQDQAIYSSNRLTQCLWKDVGFVSRVRSNEINVIDLWFG
ncbi:hypothetical protein F2Q69_00035253 [Brassica cretica]|uniref:Uncharacterized protein n=1 Tax=Brassica cretica TaxID=69181 RepID=A0A8S9SGJ2_BRACR|nr:hypothetical protein F2Q69_00035253 [Brassica cretica]